MNFESASNNPRSEKISLARMRAERKSKQFILYAGNIYYKQLDYHVDDIKQSGVSLERVYSLGEVIEGTFFYSYNNKTVYFHLYNDEDPKDESVGIVHIFFFSNAPTILSWDIEDGDEVEWLPLVESIGSVGQRLDDEVTGIVLESSSDIKLINSHGFFDDIFDFLIWENKRVDFYSWIYGTEKSEIKKIFEGVVESKDFDPQSVTFRVKDFVYRLRDFLKLPLFNESDGRINPSLNETPKRRIYGQVQQVKTVCLDNVLDGFELTGLISIANGSNELIGSGSMFLSELGFGDEIIFSLAGQDYKFGIESVVSDTLAYVNNESEVTINLLTGKNLPSVNYKFNNRNWHIAGHKLRQANAVIAEVVSNNRFIVDSSQDIFAGDQVLINTDLVTIRRISGNEIVTETAVFPIPEVSDIITKLPIQKVYFGQNELIYLRDWTYVNSTESIININEDAEFNIAQDKLISINLTFTNGSRSITTAATADFRSIIKNNDFIRKNSIVSGENDYYEIIEVKEQEILLRTPFTGTTQSITAYYRNVDHINDESIITCDCLGMEYNGSWIKTPSNAVRHMLLSDAAFDSVDETSFERANADCDYILSIVMPDAFESDPPSIRDTITRINESVFGSLYGESSSSIKYSILNSEKPEDTTNLFDDDILSFSSETSSDIKNSIMVNYRPYFDFFSNEDSFLSITYNSGFVDETSQIKSTESKTLYLFEEDKATIIAQRLALFKSMPVTKVVIKSKMNLFLTSVSDKIFMSFDRLFNRYGGGDRLKIGAVVGTKKSFSDCEVTVSDLGNVFNRVPAIAPNSANDYSGSSNEENVKWGYILDNQTETPDPTSDVGLGNNIIG